MQFQEVILVLKKNEDGDWAWQQQGGAAVVAVWDMMFSKGVSEVTLKPRSMPGCQKMRGHGFVSRSPTLVSLASFLL